MERRDPRQHCRATRCGDGAESATILPFPTGAASAASTEDLLIDRLRRGKLAVADHCLSEWADPLDAAILAALLIDQPAHDLDRRERAARLARQKGEAYFWHQAGAMLLAITSGDAEASAS